MTRGLRLNIGKTQILSAAQARRYFHQAENDYLTIEAARIVRHKRSPFRTNQIVVKVRKRFDEFMSKVPYGHNDKVLKRYLGLFAALKDEYAISYCSRALISDPGMRDAIWRYLAALGPLAKTFKILRDYLLNGHALDDSSVFHAAALLVGWHVQPNSKMHKDIRALGVLLGSPRNATRSAFYFLAAVWLVSKYGIKKELGDLLSTNLSTWRTSEFLSRQVAATMPKFRNDAVSKNIRSTLHKHQFPSSMTVLSSLENMITSHGTISGDVRLYLLNGRKTSNYSLQRFLLCLHVLTSRKIPNLNRSQLRDDILRYLKDPLYIRVLRAIKI